MTPRLLLLVPTTTYRARVFVEAAKRLPVDLSIASEVPSALAHLHPVELPAFDFSDPDAIAAFISRFSSTHPIDAVVAVDDQATMAAAIIADALDVPGNPPEAAHATMNKYRMRCLMEAARVPNPFFRLLPLNADVTAVARELSYPVVVKPLMMAASRGVIRANDAQELIAAVERVAPIVSADDAPRDIEAREHLLIEGFIPGWEVAVEAIITDGKLDVTAIFDKPDPLDGPYFPETIYTTPTRLSDEDRAAAVDMTREVVSALGLRHGPIHAELRGQGGQVRLVEIAARSIGGLCSKVLRFEGGRSLEDVILQHALGHVTTPPDRERRASGVMMLQAPARGRFESIDGVDDARTLEGVDEVIVSATPGRELAPLPEGFLYLGFIFASGETPLDVERTLREAYARLRIVMTPA